MVPKVYFYSTITFPELRCVRFSDAPLSHGGTWTITPHIFTFSLTTVYFPWRLSLLFFVLFLMKEQNSLMPLRQRNNNCHPLKSYRMWDKKWKMQSGGAWRESGQSVEWNGESLVSWFQLDRQCRAFFTDTGENTPNLQKLGRYYSMWGVKSNQATLHMIPSCPTEAARRRLMRKPGGKTNKSLLWLRRSTWNSYGRYIMDADRVTLDTLNIPRKQTQDNGNSLKCFTWQWREEEPSSVHRFQPYYSVTWLVIWNLCGRRVSTAVEKNLGHSVWIQLHLHHWHTPSITTRRSQVGFCFYGRNLTCTDRFNHYCSAL